MDDKTRLQFGEVREGPAPSFPVEEAGPGASASRSAHALASGPIGSLAGAQEGPDPEEQAREMIGAVIDRRYRIESLLAVGGMGAVYRAEQVFIHREVALKLLHPNFAADPDAAMRFRREAEIAAQLKSPHVVDVLDFGQTSDPSGEGRFYLTMELLPGESLQALIEREGKLPPARAVSILRQLLVGLGAAHAAGIVHRDLKPENLWLVPASDGDQLKILDFGIAKLMELRGGTSRTHAGLVLGTPEYLAPEQAFGKPLDHRADLYAVGLIAFLLLSGRHPFPSDTVRGLMMAHAVTPVPPLGEAVPELAGRAELVEFVARASEKDPEARPKDAQELLALLDADAARGGKNGTLPSIATRATEALPARAAVETAPGSHEPDAGMATTVAAAGVRRELRMMRVVERAIAAWPGIRDGLVRGARAVVEMAWRVGPALRSRRVWIPSLLAVLVVGGLLVSRWSPTARARRALERNQPEEALRILGKSEGATAACLRGRALHDLHRDGEALEQYRTCAALDLGALRRREVLADLSDDLRGARSAEAEKLLVLAGEPAVEVLADAAADGQSHKRRWAAIEALRSLGHGDRVDLVAAYLADLKAKECNIVSQAARSLGELGDRRAIPALREVAGRKVVGVFDACGSNTARAALRKLEP